MCIMQTTIEAAALEQLRSCLTAVPHLPNDPAIASRLLEQGSVHAPGTAMHGKRAIVTSLHGQALPLLEEASAHPAEQPPPVVVRFLRDMKRAVEVLQVCAPIVPCA